MEIHDAYCSKCGTEVRLTVARAPALHGQATLPDGGELVCLDYARDRCAGGYCPISGRPDIIMAYRLARHGPDEDRWPRLQGICPACGHDAELKRLGEAHVFCTLCETASVVGRVRSVDA